MPPLPGHAQPVGFEPAYLKVEGGEKIECLFNPKEYSITKASQWPKKQNASAIPNLQYGGGEPCKLSLDLFFDATDKADGDVRKITDKLFGLLEANKIYNKEKKKRPPSVEFCWGRTWTFPAVIESLTVGYSLFKPDGTPIRASAKLSLTQVEKAVAKPTSGSAKKGQNPTTRGMADLRSHTVRDGDSLPSISFASYGDPTLWRTIAEANGVDDPLALRRGRILAVPQVDA
jgi:Contractile injection system tube protein/LysM domain